MEANAGRSFQMQMIFNIFPRISLHFRLVPVQFWEYEYGLLSKLLKRYPLSKHSRFSLRAEKGLCQLSDLVFPINSEGIIDVANYHWCANRSLIGCQNKRLVHVTKTRSNLGRPDFIAPFFHSLGHKTEGPMSRLLCGPCIVNLRVKPISTELNEKVA